MPIGSYDGVRFNIWIFGEAGVGKSYYCKSFNPYLKSFNKWWDGY